VSASPLPGAPWQGAADPLERYLIERYALFSTWHGRVLRARIAHQPWTIVRGHLDGVDTTTVAAAGFRAGGDAIVHLGRPVDVTVHAPRRVR
jgi:uncharacterized protein YqjF (DUF2071 family)